jgi:glycosyltransferase involved in cell wall biosynthesis
VIVPCFDEASHVGKVLASIPPWVRTIVAVDDGSTDGTQEVLRRIPDPRLEVLRHEANQGVGAAMITGYRAALAAGAEICVKVDGDGQMCLDQLPDLVAPLLREGVDYAKGNRFHPAGGLGAMPPVRLVGNGILSFLTKLVSGYWSVFDPTNGYTAIRAEALRRLPFGKLGRRYFFETSMLLELNMIGAAVVDVPVATRYAEEASSLRVRSVVAEFPALLLRGLSRRFFWRYLICDFNALTMCVLLGVPSLAFGSLYGLYHLVRANLTGVATTPGTAMLVALPIILGVQALLVALVLDMLYEPRRPFAARESGAIARETRAPAGGGSAADGSPRGGDRG